MNDIYFPIAIASFKLLRSLGLLVFVVLLWRSTNWKAQKNQRLLDELESDVPDDEPYWIGHEDEPRSQKR